MKDIKHIRREFHSVAWVIPQVWDLGVGGGGGLGWAPLGPWGGTKRSNIIKGGGGGGGFTL